MTHKANLSIQEQQALWLDQACAGLPRSVQEASKRELNAHLADATDEYLAGGLDEAEAQRRALADLGPAATVAEGFKDAHLGRQRYRLAAAASAFILFTHLLAPLLYQLAYPYLTIAFPVAYNLALMLPLIYVLIVLKQMLNWRFHLQGLDTPLRLAVAGLIMQFTADILMLLLYGFSMNTGIARVPGIFEAGPWHQVLVILLSMAGFALLGVGMVWISLRLARWDGRLFGLKKPLLAFTMVMGLSMATSGLWMTIGLERVLDFAGLIVLISHIFLWPLLTLLFFRAAYRPPYRPASLA